MTAAGYQNRRGGRRPRPSLILGRRSLARPRRWPAAITSTQYSSIIKCRTGAWRPAHRPEACPYGERSPAESAAAAHVESEAGMRCGYVRLVSDELALHAYSSIIPPTFQRPRTN